MEQLKLATYNIRMDTPDVKEDRWENRKEPIFNIIQTYDFDIIGLQEVKESQLKDIQTLTEYTCFGRGRSNDDSNEYNPIFYKKEKFDVQESGTFWLSETLKHEERDKRWDADCPRICTWGRFRIKLTGKEFFVFNTHFDHKSENARYHSAQILMNRMSIIDLEIPIFLTGDFNGDLSERYYQVLNSELRNVVQESPRHIGPIGTCTGVGFNHQLNIEQYQCIDYIFANKNATINNTTVITEKFNGRYPSDHFPVYLDTTIR
ncbi:hypothetical protein CWR48_00010 [Oceanobacillus arenosus]|uniref:Endonuclease/exonuclease/phosphatase domain-containing protein n=1 Tax=Oceanobacillus arenosus TaxID=1229153 RepID=A0A3D8Q1H2_9BACI|nr:endonuclease/exonuclease/phosphatase family protein [Oceanobacillus arenosus]RDW22134.1 hypothetical protein CWR48_00010 [Oceanobacillus arenosus]